MTSPIVLCEQTADEAVAREWFETLAAAGIEGRVTKDAAAPYPTRDGQRVWWKVRVTGWVSAPIGVRRFETVALGPVGGGAS